MKVLVVAASRHGSTEMIADCIREELESSGCRTHLADPDSVRDISEYDAVVLGSAVYDGRWLTTARKLASRIEPQLDGKPVWLFSSGPVGGQQSGPVRDAVEWTARLHARGHEVFAGRLDRTQLGVLERVAARGLHAPDGDDRSWLEIGRWARAIAAALRTPEAAQRLVPSS